MERKYYSEASAAIHESARDLFEVGAIDGDRMREFDEMCFVEEQKTLILPSILPEHSRKVTRPLNSDLLFAWVKALTLSLRHQILQIVV